MYLEEITAIGFKSFANKTVLKFPKPSAQNQGITAIVGPNGSGKSNVADALRWVLGESSAKTLRGKSRDDVIFSGSAKKNRMNYAEVTLKLNNENGTGGIEMSEIEITRRVFRNGDSEFLLNKNKVRRDDILMMLAKASFGQKTYTVIGQGMADAVLSASLQERREFFEEAAGVKQYQIKRHQTLLKFDQTRENLAQTELTLKELEPRLRSLGRQMKKLEQRSEIEKDLKDLQLAYYNHIFSKLKAEVSENEGHKKDLEKESKRIEKEIQSIQEKMNTMYAGDSRHSVFSALQKEHNALIVERNNLLREEALIKAKKDAEYQKGGKSNLVWLDQKKTELNKKINELEAKRSELEQLISKEQSALADKKQSAEQITKRIATVKQDLEQLRSGNIADFDEMDDLLEIQKMQDKLLDELMNAKDASRLEDLRNQAKAIAAKMAVYLESLAQKKRSSSEDYANLQNQLEQLTEEKNQVLLSVTEIELNINLKKEKIETIAGEITQVNDELGRIQNEITLASSQSDTSSLLTEIEKQLDEIRAKIGLLDKDILEIEKRIESFNEEEEEKKEALIALQKESQQKQQELNTVSGRLNNLNIEIAKFTIRIEDLEKEVAEEELSLSAIESYKSQEPIAEEEAHQRIHQLKKQMEIIGGIDDETVQEYNEIKERHDFLTEQTQDMEQAIVSMEKIIEELDQTIKKQFDKAFAEINKEFGKYFKVLFSGGNAELKKVSLEEEKKKAAEEESEDAASAEATASQGKTVLDTVDKIAKRIKEREKEAYSGIEIAANPPGKKISSINMLSGGERALTSIALISAIIANNNSPFVLLDEMDAALDESNALRFASILKDLSEKTQFIVITHTRATMSQAQVLYGVTMGDDGVSQLLSIELKDAEEMDVVRH